MTRNKLDYEDTLVWALFGLAAAASVGIADVTLFGYAFTDVIFEIGSGNHGVTVATILTAGTFGFVYFTNEPDLDSLDDEYKYAVIGTVVLIVVIPFVPQVHDFVTSSDVYALVTMAVQSGSLIVVSYMG